MSNNLRIGFGFDSHQIEKGDSMTLGGVEISCGYQIFAHSDGDVVLHAITDAILGATKKKDIGTYFPNTKKFKNIRSPKMLEPVINNLNNDHFYINNLDINLICEKPKVSKLRE